MIRVLSRIKSEPWAITRESMDTILEIAARENESPQAVAAKLGRPLENSYDTEIRDGIAILSINGPLFRYANLFTALSGATSYDLLARDFAAAVDNPSVESILLNIDSPGGEASGVSEFADMIYAARSKKPIVAYVGGCGASAAYWLASAADRIIIDETAMLGSIGVVLGVQDSSERDAKAGIKRMEIVSAQSPYKRVDASSDEGQSRLQARVDALAEVFVAKVARNRNTDVDTVLKDFGQGDVFVGQAAVNAGLADRIGSYEGTISELRSRTLGRAGSIAAAGGNNEEIAMGENNNGAGADKPTTTLTAAQVAEQHPQAAADLRAEAVTGERARVKGILGHEEASGRDQLAQHLAFNTGSTVDDAVAMLKVSPKAAATTGATTAIDKLDKVMRAEGNANVGADDAQGEQTEDQKSLATLREAAKAQGLA